MNYIKTYLITRIDVTDPEYGQFPISKMYADRTVASMNRNKQAKYWLSKYTGKGKWVSMEDIHDMINVPNTYKLKNKMIEIIVDNYGEFKKTLRVLSADGGLLLHLSLEIKTALHEYLTSTY